MKLGFGHVMTVVVKYCGLLLIDVGKFKMKITFFKF